VLLTSVPRGVDSISVETHSLELVRMDGTDDDLLGYQGRLRTKVCWATPPYDAFDCPQEPNGVRLDGAKAFFWKHSRRIRTGSSA
jgi:hypothetical protein